MNYFYERINNMAKFLIDVKLDGTNKSITPLEFWYACTPAEKEELKEFVVERFNLPLLGLGLPLDESVIEYMIEMYGDNAMHEQAMSLVKESIRNLVWKIEHKNYF